jgi:hypothetical protein
MIAATFHLRDGRTVTVTSTARELLFDNKGLVDLMVRLDEDGIAPHVECGFTGPDGRRSTVRAGDIASMSLGWSA